MRGRTTRLLTICTILLASLSGVEATEKAEEVKEDFWAKMVERHVAVRTHSISPPYVDSDLQNRWWDFGADTVINTNKHIRLTQDRPSQQGWLWSRIPFTSTNWQIEFEFKVDGKAHNLYGDGFAMWITEERAQSGPVFGSRDNFTGVGLFFDTYANTKHSFQFPRVTAMLGDGQTPYDHGGDNEAHEFAGCSDSFRRRAMPTKARLTYMRGKMLRLELSTKYVDDWKECFNVKVDVPSTPPPYIGFTALTGDVSDNHDIISVNTVTATLRKEFREVTARVPKTTGADKSRTDQQVFGVDDTSKPVKRAKSGSSGATGWFLFLLKIIGVGAFVAFAVAAYRTWDAQKQSTRRAW